MRGEVIEQRLLVLRQPEEVVLLADPLRVQRRVERAVAVDEILLLLERLAADAVPALVDALVDVAGVVEPLAISVTPALCRGSVVRMKSSNDTSSCAHVLRNSRSIWSQYASGSSPSSAAFLNTFCECSSLPIRKRVSKPHSRL